MATLPWAVPTGKTITGSTYIKDTDNKIQDTINDLVDYVNNTGDHAGTGLSADYVDVGSAQAITGVKTFSNGIISNVTGDVTGNTSGNAGTATKLATARNIGLSGDVSGSASFDGSSNVTITATVADDSHNHIIGNVDGLQTALDGKLGSTANAVSASKLNTTRNIALSGDVTGNVNFDGTSNVSISTTVANYTHNHDSRYYTETEVNTLLAGKQAAGTYNTVIGTDSDINTSGSTIIDNIYVTDGVITSMGTRNLTTSDLGLSYPATCRLYWYKYITGGSSGYNIQNGITVNWISCDTYTATFDVTFSNSNLFEQVIIDANIRNQNAGSYLSYVRQTIQSGYTRRYTAHGVGLNSGINPVIIVTGYGYQ